jgi:general secretion pathway protein A
MYNEYFGFKEAPFSIAPNPRYLYMTDQHREALAHLVYGVSSEGGCILLTGEVGTGKTTICRGLLEHLPDHSNIALVFNPKLTVLELLETICDELNIDYPETGNTVKTYTDRINDFLIEAHARNEKTVLIIDEAQNLDSSVLEQLRLLTNLETDQRKLLQIIILGQPELLDILSRQEMRQLAQRITARFHLNALSGDEIKAYVNHRLAVAGQNAQLFPEKTVKKLYGLSKGIPRLINILCDRALLGAYVQNTPSVSPQTMDKAAKEVFGELKSTEGKYYSYKTWLPFVLPAAIAMVAVFLYTQLPTQLQTDTSTVTTENQQAISVEKVAIAPMNTAPVGNEPGLNTPAINIMTPLINIEAELNTPDIKTVVLTNNTPAQAKHTIDPIENFIKSLPGNNKGPAYSALFKVWKHEFSKHKPSSACVFAQSKGLSCLHRQGNLRSLSQLNRPAILKLYNNDGDSSYALLTYLNTREATLNTGKEELQVDTYTLDSHWLGEYTLLWQKPPFYNEALQQGSQGPIVQWLDQVLVRLYGQKDVPTISDTYTKELIVQVKKFQHSKGLVADGVAGPLTFIHLNSEIGIETPLLKTSLRTSKS